MSIEIGSKWVKDGEVVEVEIIKDNHFNNNCTARTGCVWFWDEQGGIHVLTERDFLEQYKPYEVVYEWQWVFLTDNFKKWNTTEYLTEEEFIAWQCKAPYSLEYKRLDFTKRERK